jgi:type I restriction enzyme S subunit
MKGNYVPLESLMVRRGGSVDPSKFKDEEFDLYSIPAFDRGGSDLVFGRDIGSSKQVLETGDVLLSKIVPHIRRAWVVGASRQRRIIGSGEWIVFRAAKSANPRYLSHVLVGDPFHSQFMQTVSGVGGSLLRARPAQVAKIEIPLPPLAEQKRIAAILDAADALRTKRREALAQLDALLQSTFLTLFGDPVSNPMGWPMVELGNVADLITGYAFKSEDYTLEGDAIRLCRGTNVLPNRIDWSDLAKWPQNRTSDLTRFSLVSGDIVMAMDRPWISEGFKIARIRAEDCPALLVQRVARLRGENRITNDFLYYLLRHHSFTRHCRPTETTVPHISPTDIRSYPFPIPPLPLQRRFAAIVESVERQKAAQRAHLAELDALFAALQHRAFRGEL